MKFLITSNPKYPLPPEVASDIMGALLAWSKKYSDNGKFEIIWSYAGKTGGGGIANVDTLEELDALMTEFPMAPFSEVEVTPIVDLHPSIERAREFVEVRAKV